MKFEDSVLVGKVCPICHELHQVEVSEADYNTWSDGTLVQDAFPYLSAEEREILVSGICPDCWDSMFSDEEEESDEDYEPDYDECGFNPYMGWYDFDC